MLPPIITNIATRIFYLGVGGFGVMSIMPNIMLGDSGTDVTIRASQRGLAASTLFVFSGIAGVIHPVIPLRIAQGLGLTGFVTQISAFIF